MVTFSQAGDLGPYQMILDVQILGIKKKDPPPPGIEPEARQTASSWSRKYRMTMMTRDADGLRVGIQNLRDQSSWLLVEGDDSASDFMLVSGDYNSGTARIRFRGMEHFFTIEAGPASETMEGQHASHVSPVRSSPSGTGTVRRRRRRVILKPQLSSDN